MLKKLIFLFVLCLSTLGNAQNTTLFNDATTAYNNGNYNKAIENYLQIVENGEHSAELYYNLGNAYYKLNQIAPSIYYYEKALLLKPNDSEIKNNLSYAQNMTLDAFEILPETQFSKIYKTIVGTFSFDQWSYIAILFVFLFVFLYIAFKQFRYSTKKRIAFIGSIFSLFIVFTSLLFAYAQYKEFNAKQPAIIFTEEVVIKSDPNNSGQELFRLHSGTKVNIEEELKDWRKISLVDGQTGWLLAENIKPLKDF
ncbi:tetratricopeptide repeat protein [uncultured Maribacter sp.]|uniref:tetratricopeptide repeat protein n=1 Tax=uncultured Maribacter sp. TaxID=431308 RepID=UPI002619A974|nr:tetratricopeptide repeat protein [uncultured Maribacter sp.]